MSCTCHLYSRGDACDYCLSQTPELHISLEEEYRQVSEFASGLTQDAADLPKADPAQQLADAEKLRKWVEAVGTANR
jgi:hypothetical protein